MPDATRASDAKDVVADRITRGRRPCVAGDTAPPILATVAVPASSD